MAEEPWFLYYWMPGKLLGRGEFVRLMFEELGVSYEEPEKTNPGAVLEMMTKGRQGGLSYPLFAPPVIAQGHFVLNQTPAIMRYLGRRYGAYPETEEDVAHADALGESIADFIAEGRLVFHPKAFTASYHEQEEEAKPFIAWFERERLAKHMGVLENALKANNGGSGFFFGEKLTYVDISAFHVTCAAESQFPEAYAKVEAPLLKAHKERISQRPNIAAYLASDRRGQFEGNSMM